jgi:hypothetical protein
LCLNNEYVSLLFLFFFPSFRVLFVRSFDDTSAMSDSELDFDGDDVPASPERVEEEREEVGEKPADVEEGDIEGAVATGGKRFESRQTHTHTHTHTQVQQFWRQIFDLLPLSLFFVFVAM